MGNNDKKVWSSFQKKCFLEIAKGKDDENVIIIARAGSSKTTVLVEGSKYIPRGKKSLFCAFNKSIQLTLRDKLGSYCDTKTLHSLGLQSIKSRFGNVEVDDYKCWNIVSDMIGNEKENYDLIDNVCKAVAFCKARLVDVPAQIDELIAEFDIDVCELQPDIFIQHVCQALRRCKEKTTCIDFNDMVHFPFVYRIKPPQYDVVFIDECLPGPTPILLADGSSKTIQEIVDNELPLSVLAYDTTTGQQKVCKVIRYSKTPNKKPLVKITTENINVSIICTTDHKVWANETWIPAGNLIPGMRLQIKDRSLITYEAIGSIVPTTIDADYVYDLEVEDCHNFYANGILVHNCQDLTKAQIELALSAVKPGGRVIAVLDDRQVLYGFAGVELNVLDYLRERLKAKELSLPICYRCPKSVVKLAQKYVPDIQPYEHAIEGDIYHIHSDDLFSKVKAGCFVLSRVNAPLISLCMTMITKYNIKANILGRDIGNGLHFLIKKSKKKTIPKLIEWLTKWEKQEKERIHAKNPKANVEYITDKAECIFNLCEGANSIEEVKKNIDRMFKDTDEKDVVWLSTIHKRKGAETDSVFILADTLRHNDLSEENCNYVALTRCKRELYYVSKNNSRAP